MAGEAIKPMYRSHWEGSIGDSKSQARALASFMRTLVWSNEGWALLYKLVPQGYLT